MTKTVFFLGAGASEADGAPKKADILPFGLEGTLAAHRPGDREGIASYLNHLLDRKGIPQNERSENILRFLKEFYPSDFGSNGGYLPTLEEIFSIVDIAIEKQEYLSGGWDYKELLKLRDDLTNVLMMVLDAWLRNPGGVHKKFIDRLSDSRYGWKDKPDKFSFISLNYPIILSIVPISLERMTRL